MHNFQCSTPSLTLNDGSSSSIDESLTSCHSYNTRLSARLRASKSRVSSCRKNSLSEQHPISTIKPLLLKPEEAKVIPHSLNEIMPSGYGPCGPPTCMEKFCKYMVMFLAIVGMAVISSYLLQNLQGKQRSYGCFDEELSNLKSELTNMKSEVQDMYASKDDTEKKLDVIESLVRELKRATQHTPDSNKCPARRPSKSSGSRKDIDDALNLYSEDKTGKTDFALESAGGSILDVRNTESFSIEKVHFLGITICNKANSANAMLQPGTLPGECWAFKGSQGCAIVQLLGNVRITGVSLEHISSTMSPSGDIRTAPKEFTIKGLACKDCPNTDILGTFTYDSNGPKVQYFDIPNSTKPFRVIEFRVLSNHGHPEFTCVYRLRVHGELQK